MTTFVEEVRMAVKANSGIRSLKDLSGKVVATTTGTTSVQHLRKYVKATGVEWKELLGKDHQDSFLLLESGRANAFVLDSGILAAAISSSNNPSDYAIVGELLSVEPVALMLRKDDFAFKKAVDDTIKSMARSSELLQLWDKWFLKPIPPKGKAVGLALSASTRAAWDNPNDRPMEDYAENK